MLAVGSFRCCPRLCKNSARQLAHRMSISIFVNRRTNSAGDCDREKAVEKTILRNLSSCTFLHSLDPKRPFGLCPPAATLRRSRSHKERAGRIVGSDFNVLLPFG